MESYYIYKYIYIYTHTHTQSFVVVSFTCIFFKTYSCSTDSPYLIMAQLTTYSLYDGTKAYEFSRNQFNLDQCLI
jgi:hypothetical protein